MSQRCRRSHLGLWIALIVLLQCTLLPAAVGNQYSNIFLNGDYQASASAAVITNNSPKNPFLNHAIISRQAAPFTGPTYLPPREPLKCANNQQCVRKENCQGGYYFTAGSALPKSQSCNVDTDVCCSYRAPAPQTTTPRQFIPCGSDSDCVQVNDCRNGEITTLTYMKTKSTDRCFAPEVCCRLPSTTLTQDGYLVKVPQKVFPLPTYPSVPVTTNVYRPQTQPQPKPTNEYIPPQTTQTHQGQPSAPQPTQLRPSPPRPQPQPLRPQLPNNAYLPPQSVASTRQTPAQTTQAVYRPQPQPTTTQQVYRPQPQTTQQTYRSPPQPQTTQQTYGPQTTQQSYRPQPQPQTTQQTYRPQSTQQTYRPQPQTTQQTYRPQPQTTQQTYSQQPQTTQQTYRPQPQPSTTQQVYRPQQPQQRSKQPSNEYLPPGTSASPVAVSQTTKPRVQQQSRPQTPAVAYRPQAKQQPIGRGQPNKGYLPPITDNRIPEEIDRIPESSNVKPLRGEDQLSPVIFPPRPNINSIAKSFSKCASALVCTPENYCNNIGVITDTPVDLSPASSAFRVPLTDCIIPDSGAEGKCCRDSNYVDPWPVNLAGVCATKNKNTKPAGIKDIDANFAEIPWQAMILKESAKSLLCGGAIVGDEFVLTAASCIAGEPASDIRVKAGEWELGGTNEPLPFQLVGVKSINLHPSYDQGSGANDMAILRLEKRLEFASHIQPICLSDEEPSGSEQCVTTGWGKQALQIHEEGAIMHVTRTSIASRSDCGADGTAVCAAPEFDACEFDIGSALACGSGSSVRLKGIYIRENGCGEGQAVRFSKPDIKWINTAFADRNRPLLKRRA